MAAFDALGYEGKPLLALKHPIPETRILAIQLLGELKSLAATRVFAAILDEEDDHYILREITCALARINDESARALLGRLSCHPSIMVRQTAVDACRAMTRLDSGSGRSPAALSSQTTNGNDHQKAKGDVQ
jgi:HEAT repeat protein